MLLFRTQLLSVQDYDDQVYAEYAEYAEYCNQVDQTDAPFRELIRAPSAISENTKIEWRLGHSAHREELEHKARSFLDHVKENHIFSGKYHKSIFEDTKLCDIWSFVERTLTCPDEEVKDKERLSFKKSFNTLIGVHGFSGAECHTVKVIYDVLQRRLNSLSHPYMNVLKNLCKTLIVKWLVDESEFTQRFLRQMQHFVRTLLIFFEHEQLQR